MSIFAPIDIKNYINRVTGYSEWLKHAIREGMKKEELHIFLLAETRAVAQ